MFYLLPGDWNEPGDLQSDSGAAVRAGPHHSAWRGGGIRSDHGEFVLYLNIIHIHRNENIRIDYAVQ